MEIPPNLTISPYIYIYISLSLSPASGFGGASFGRPNSKVKIDLGKTARGVFKPRDPQRVPNKWIEIQDPPSCELSPSELHLSMPENAAQPHMKLESATAHKQSVTKT